MVRLLTQKANDPLFAWGAQKGQKPCPRRLMTSSHIWYSGLPLANIALRCDRNRNLNTFYPTLFGKAIYTVLHASTIRYPFDPRYNVW
ncbi:hypothetical protein J6590_019431 [Homalodisca vitripennis]|nr:hypothetical protein J6590_019431 [Homalodisca vitripennis]